MHSKDVYGCISICVLTLPSRKNPPDNTRTQMHARASGGGLTPAAEVWTEIRRCGKIKSTGVTFTEDWRGLLARFRKKQQRMNKEGRRETSQVSLKKSRPGPPASTWHHQDNPLHPVSKISFWFRHTRVQNVSPRPPTPRWPGFITKPCGHRIFCSS